MQFVRGLYIKNEKTSSTERRRYCDSINPLFNGSCTMLPKRTPPRRNESETRGKIDVGSRMHRTEANTKPIRMRSFNLSLESNWLAKAQYTWVTVRDIRDDGGPVVRRLQRRGRFMRRQVFAGVMNARENAQLGADCENLYRKETFSVRIFNYSSAGYLNWCRSFMLATMAMSHSRLTCHLKRCRSMFWSLLFKISMCECVIISVLWNCIQLPVKISFCLQNNIIKNDIFSPPFSS